MKKNKTSYYHKRLNHILFQMAVWSLITSLIWTLLNIYTAWQKEKGVEVDKTILRPINVKFDTEILKTLKERQGLPPNFELSLPASQSGQN